MCPEFVPKGLIDELLHRGVVPPGRAKKIRGHATWTGSNCAGRIGRHGLHYLKNFEHTAEPYKLQEHDVASLSFLKLSICSAPPRDLQMVKDVDYPVVLYSDDFFAPGQPTRIGWVIFVPGQQPIGTTAVIPEEHYMQWQERQTQNTPTESFAAPVATMHHKALLENRSVIWFVDNQGAASALIKGSSFHTDFSFLAERSHALWRVMNTRTWIEWNDRDSNPSYGLSRLGLHDPWTLKQGWLLQAVLVPAFLYTESAFERILDPVFQPAIQ